MKLMLSIGLSVLLVSTSLAAGGASPKSATRSLQSTGTGGLQISSRQRGDLARVIVMKWGRHVRDKGIDLEQWALKVGRLAGTADAMRLYDAAGMPTFELAMSTLQGAPDTGARSRRIASRSLGSATADTTYTPLANGRCRIADSRVIASPLTPFVERNLDVLGVASYASQGGNGSTGGDGSTNCGFPSTVTAYAVSLTILPPAGVPSGLLKVYEGGKPWTEGNPVLFTLNDFGASNDVIVKSCGSCAQELAIQSGSAVHYVVDIVGYFAPPVATEFDCVNTSVNSFSIAANTTNFFNNPTCPAGYRATTPYCWTAASGVYSQGSGFNANAANNATFCAWQNTTGSSQTVFGGNVCCRVPGR